MKILRTTAFWICIISIPLLIITSNIRFLVNEIKVYDYIIDNYYISDITGIDNTQLHQIYQHWIDYYNSKADSPQIEVTRNGQKFDLLSEKEVVHLQDVKRLMQLDYTVQLISFIIFLVCAVLLILQEHGKQRWRQFLKALLRGSILTGGVVIIIGLLSLFFFDQLFVLFHRLSFTNEFWILDPAHDYLIMLFPGGFFYDIALFGFGIVIMQSVILSLLAYLLLKFVIDKKSVAGRSTLSSTGTATGR